MSAITYTLYNYSTIDATLTQITFTSPGVIPHTADLSNFGGYLAGETAFTGVGTLPSTTAEYVSDTRPENAVYVAHYNTGSNFYLIVDSTNRIESGWEADGNGYTSGQTVLTVTSSTWLRMSAAPSFSPTVGQAITFSTSDVYLFVDSVTAIDVGDVASGNGYSIGQYVVSKNSGLNRLTMSDYPNGIPSVGGEITFTDQTPIGLLPAGSSTTFVVNYTAATSVLDTYARDISISAILDVPVTKTINNLITLSNTPIAPEEIPTNYYFPDAGGDSGAPASPAPANCTDPSNVDCSNPAAASAGGGECFTGDTLINVSGGNTKRIDQIQIGDLVIDALTGNPNKVIGIKVTDYEAGRRLFATKAGVKPFITEQHAFYNEKNELCAMSNECEYLAPWLGPIKIVDVPEIETAQENITVYNLMFETGNSHYANGVPVSNMVGHGGTYVLMQKGFISKEDYEGYIYHLENTVGLNSLSQEHKAKVFKIVFKLSKYILNNDNLQSRMLARLMGWAIRNRTTLYPYMEKWFKSRIRNWIFKK